jgi:L-ascorbate metabolism protein UlaG (beta-lactamase superfamily)
MKRALSALIVVVSSLLLAGPGLTGEKPAAKVTIVWHGQSFFEIKSSKGTRVVIDPHAIAEFGRIGGVNADLILTTHLHTDHVQLDVVENYKPNDKSVKVHHGLKGDVQKHNWNPIDEKFKDFHIRSVKTFHDDMMGMKRGKNTCYVLEVDGFRIVHLGDLGHELTADQLKSIGKVDVLMIPVGGIYTLNGTEAKDVVDQIKPSKYIIPMHYGIPGTYEDLLTVKEFTEQFPANRVAQEKDNKLVLLPGFTPPNAPIVAVLNWQSKLKGK